MKAKCALITGASRGIGRATAEVFAAHGYHLILNCKTHTGELSRLCTKLQQTYSIQCFASFGDVSRLADCKALIAMAEQTFGGVDVLVNNAGISRIGLLMDTSCEEWDELLQTNLNSVFYCSRLVLPLMLRQKSGKIINVSSVWGEVGASCEVAYSTSKGGVNAFTKALARELAPSNIQVNAISFGAIDTQMNSHLQKDDLQALLEEIPAGRLGTASEAANMIFLLAESPSYLTGQIIRMDGGWC